MTASPKDHSPDAEGGGPADDEAFRGAGASEGVGRRLREWAARTAAKLPPMTESEAAAAARLAARLDAEAERRARRDKPAA